jgi:hypothetical protein
MGQCKRSRCPAEELFRDEKQLVDLAGCQSPQVVAQKPHIALVLVAWVVVQARRARDLADARGDTGGNPAVSAARRRGAAVRGAEVRRQARSATSRTCEALQRTAVGLKYIL